MASNFKIQILPSLSLQVSQFSPIPMFSTFNFSSRSTILPQFRVSIPFNRLHCLSLSSSTSPPSPISVSENSSNKHPFEVSYLINTFGWPPEFAISKAKKLKFETPEKPERMLAYLKKHGFTETQISYLLKRAPRLLLCDPETTILPKFEFFRKHGFNETQISHIIKSDPRYLISNPEKTFQLKFEFLSSLGLSTTEITCAVTKAPHLLHRSLEPTFNLISKLVNSDDEAVKLVKRYPTILTHNPELDNIQILLEAGVPGANIVASMTYQRKGYTPNPDSFRNMVEEVKGMGFDPCTMNFLYALRTIRSLSKSTWEDKVQVLKKYGWSDRDIFLAFEKSPKFIWSSKDKIERVMDFLVNRMGMEATDVAAWPSIIGLSLENRIVPRCLFYQSMVEKGLCEKKFSFITLCSFTEDQFLTRIIKPYNNEAPELWDLYKEMLNVKK